VSAMEEELQQTTPKALWLLIILPPAIGAAAMQADFVLVRQACAAQRNVALYGVTIVGLALMIATAFIAFTIWRVEGSRWPTEEADLSTRIRFIAMLGILSSAMSFLLLLAQGIATMLFDPCQW
jgi:membrane protein YdbS with pleckstrin-like domain